MRWDKADRPMGLVSRDAPLHRVGRLATCAGALALEFLVALAGSAQTASPPQESEGTAAQAAAKAPQQQEKSTSGHQTTEQRKQPKRLFYVIPLFSVSYEKNPAPLTPGGKFRIFARNITDLYTILSTAAQAGIEQAEDHFPEYGQGAQGYGKRFGADYADASIGGFFTTFAFPSLLREDPRYFRAGQGPIQHRLGHAIASTFVTRTDSGRRSLNWHNMLGRLVAGGIALSYYPDGQRTAGHYFSRFGYSVGSSALNNTINEFGYDVQKWLFKHVAHEKQAAPAQN